MEALKKMKTIDYLEYQKLGTGLITQRADEGSRDAASSLMNYHFKLIRYPEGIFAPFYISEFKSLMEKYEFLKERKIPVFVMEPLRGGKLASYPEEIEAVVNNQPYAIESVVISRGARIVALVYLDADKMKEEAVDIELYKATLMTEVNKSMPVYSKVNLVEIMDKPFEKTPKMSIKRFLYK